jgi:hypothetical protein
MTALRHAAAVRVDELARELGTTPANLLSLADHIIGREHRTGSAAGLSTGIRQYSQYAAATFTPALAEAVRADIHAGARLRHLEAGRVEWSIPGRPAPAKGTHV